MAQTCEYEADQRDDSGLYNGAIMTALDGNYMFKMELLSRSC